LKWLHLNILNVHGFEPRIHKLISSFIRKYSFIKESCLLFKVPPQLRYILETVEKSRIGAKTSRKKDRKRSVPEARTRVGRMLLQIPMVE
jgi:hypothetical protein